MRQLNGVYTQAYNRRHRRVGHLFQGRLKAILVEKEPHLLELCRYVVLNPVRARCVMRLVQWRWSSYRATAGEEPVPPMADGRLDLGTFWNKPAVGPTALSAVRLRRTWRRRSLGVPSGI